MRNKKIKFRHTQTNVKRRERQITTIVFAICELVAIFLFAYFGIARTSQVTDENTTVITTEIDDYAHIYSHGIKIKLHYYKIWIDEQKYNLGASLLNVDCDNLQEILDSNHPLNVRTYHNDIVEIYLGDIELVSADRYNENQTSARVLTIILFSLAEVFAIAGYVVYMIFHRTSKDKKWI